MLSIMYYLFYMLYLLEFYVCTNILQNTKCNILNTILIYIILKLGEGGI